ncbi:hypothetical protein NLU13_7879 [Sarocladium strictum]|uniref:C2H2-type domain-containing protein n=1 Tax=Sarocladium strictum TaxID=5046 RepID=A0AA39GDM1_SARSR|nr:hypothetical protein NLU13_7879 [Sarocladium strictum]
MDVNMEVNATGTGNTSAVVAKAAPGREKAFACTHPGCAKSFTRAEHLHRHALNHVPGGGVACPLCQAHFKRPDLLGRHMERHQQKDIEAGGPGCGVLDTRKRAWQAPDGTIKETKPRARPLVRVRKSARAPKAGVQRQNHQQQQQQQSSISGEEQRRQQASSEQEQEASTSPIEEESHLAWDYSRDEDDTAHDLNQTFTQGLHDHGAGLHQTINECPVDYSAQLDYTFGAPELSSASAGYDELDYDQIFQPDTASSFNMPYTTALDYGWLFNSTKATLPLPIPGREADLTSSLIPNTQSSQPFSISPHSTSSQLWSLPSDSGFGDGSGVVPGSNSCGEQDSTPLSSPQTTGFNAISVQNTSLHPTIDPMLGHNNPSGGHYARAHTRKQQGHHQQQQQRKRQQKPDSQRIHISERPFSTLDGKINVPVLGESTRKVLLEVIESCGPSLPNGPDVSVWELPLLSLDALQEYLELFFKRFNTAYPLLHLPTFAPDKTEPLLLIAILLLGATYSTKDAHQVAVCIHDVIRPCIFAHAGFSAKPQLWSLQTILLVECFGKSRAGLKQHEMSHLFHGLLINLIRRSDCQSVKPKGPEMRPRPDFDENATWHQWAADEEKKRLALFCFMWDTEHAVLFCQSLCMSSFELRVDLPCPQAIWEARDSVSWASAWRSIPPAGREIPYLLAVKSYLNPSTPKTFPLDAMSRVLVLHGLMSVAWDMQRRDQTSLGMNPINNITSQLDWRRVIGEAYDAWQRDFDVHCATAVAHMRGNSAHDNYNPNSTSHGDHEGAGSPQEQLRTRRYALWSFAAAYSTLAGCAQILLNMDFLDVQVYAGARQILGRPVQQKDYIRSAAVVKKWAAAPKTTASGVSLDNTSATTSSAGSTPAKHCATTAATYAALNLHRHIDHLTRQDAMSLFHVPWCIYLLTLTLWASQHARAVEPSSHGTLGVLAMDEDDDEMVWDAHAEMQGLLLSLIENDGAPPRSGAAKRRTNGLVWIMTETLTKVRWGIIHGAVSVLKGLVPQRLIHRYDEPVDSKDFVCV